jgi:hypothetical protein
MSADTTSRNELSKAAAEAAIEAHNRGCLESCGKTSSHQYVRDSRLCDERRDCPDCPKDWMIEYTIEAEDRLTPSETQPMQVQDELNAIHYAALNPLEAKPQEGDTITVKLVKQFIQRAIGTGPFANAEKGPTEWKCAFPACGNVGPACYPSCGDVPTDKHDEQRVRNIARRMVACGGWVGPDEQLLQFLRLLLRQSVQSNPSASGQFDELTAIRLGAISTASIMNTRESAKEHRIGRDNPYWTVAYEDVITAVEREMDLREKLESLQSATASTGCEKHTDLRSVGPWCPVCLADERDALRQFYEGVKESFGDTCECHVCGTSDPWWKDSNADYATREAVAKIEPADRGSKA